MASALNPDKTSKAELINKMFTLFTVILFILCSPFNNVCVCVCAHVLGCEGLLFAN